MLSKLSGLYVGHPCDISYFLFLICPCQYPCHVAHKEVQGTDISLVNIEKGSVTQEMRGY